MTKHKPASLTPEETQAMMATIMRNPTPIIRLADKIHYEAVKTTIGGMWGGQCPVYLPQDPNVPHDQRRRCVRWGAHEFHTDTYLIEEQTLD